MIARACVLVFGVVAAAPSYAQQWKAIEQKDSRLELDLPEFAKHRRSLSYSQTADYSIERYFASRTLASSELPRMEVILEEAAPGRYWSTQRDIDEKSVRIWSFLKERNISALRPAPGGGNERLRISEFTIENAACFAFEAFVGNPGVRHGYSDLESRQRTYGYYCGSTGASLDASGIAHALSAVRVLNPNGVATLPGAQRAAIARRSPSTAAASPPSAAGANLAQFRAASVGTRMLVKDGTKDAGYFEVASVEGTKVRVVNSIKRYSTIHAGVFWGRSGSTVNDAQLESMWPLAVGKEVSVEETLGNDRWLHTVKVLRKETIATPAGSFDTFVIEVRDRSQADHQGGFDRTRTYWYAPSEGLIVRLRSIQNAGPPVRMYNWDASQIVRPKAP